jgi:hypothetical protein
MTLRVPLLSFISINYFHFFTSVTLTIIYISSMLTAHRRVSIRTHLIPPPGANVGRWTARFIRRRYFIYSRRRLHRHTGSRVVIAASAHIDAISRCFADISLIYRWYVSRSGSTHNYFTGYCHICWNTPLEPSPFNIILPNYDITIIHAMPLNRMPTQAISTAFS